MGCAWRYFCIFLDYGLLGDFQGYPYGLYKIYQGYFQIVRYIHSNRLYSSLKLACRVVARCIHNGIKPGFAVLLLRRGSLHSLPDSERRLEAGGFEPPSRDVSRQASTCLVVLLFFHLAKSQTTGLWFDYFGEFLPKPARTTGTASLLFDALTRPTGKVRQDGPLN